MEEFWQDYGLALSVAVFLGSVLWFICYNDVDRKAARLRRMRGKQMEDARTAFLYQHLADIVTDGFENSVYLGKVSRQEAHEMYTWMGSRLGIRDFYPIYKSRQLLKEEIKKRLNGNVYYDANENRKVIVFPDCPGWMIRFQSHPLV